MRFPSCLKPEVEAAAAHTTAADAPRLFEVLRLAVRASEKLCPCRPGVARVHDEWWNYNLSHVRAYEIRPVASLTVQKEVHSPTTTGIPHFSPIVFRGIDADFSPFIRIQNVGSR